MRPVILQKRIIVRDVFEIVNHRNAVAVVQVPKTPTPRVALRVRHVLVAAEVRHGHNVGTVVPIDSLDIAPGFHGRGVHEPLPQTRVDRQAAAPAELRLLVLEPVPVLGLELPDVLAEIHVTPYAVVGVRPPVEVGHDPEPGVALGARPRPPDAVGLLLAQVGLVLDVEDELDVGDGPRVRDRAQRPVHVGEGREPPRPVRLPLDLLDHVQLAVVDHAVEFAVAP